MGRKPDASHCMDELWEYIPHTYPIAMRHFLNLPYLWLLYGISTPYYSIDYPYQLTKMSNMCHRFPIIVILWELYGIKTLCNLTLSVLVAHRFPM